MSQKQQSFSFEHEDEQKQIEENDEQQIMQKMLEIQQEYEKMRRKYLQIKMKKTKNNKNQSQEGKNDTNNSVEQSFSQKPKPQLTKGKDEQKPQLNLTSNNHQVNYSKKHSQNISKNNKYFQTQQQSFSSQSFAFDQHQSSTYSIQNQLSFSIDQNNNSKSQSANSKAIKSQFINTNDQNSKENTFIYHQKSFQTSQYPSNQSEKQQSFVFEEQNQYKIQPKTIALKEPNKIQIIQLNYQYQNNKNSFIFNQSSLQNGNQLNSFDQDEQLQNNNSIDSSNYIKQQKHNKNIQKQSILSNSKDNESFQFKNDDSFPVYYQKRNIPKQNYNNKQKLEQNSYEQSFTYKSSTEDDSFSSKPSEKSLIAENTKNYAIQEKKQQNDKSNQSISRSFSFQESAILSSKSGDNSRNESDSFTFKEEDSMFKNQYKKAKQNKVTTDYKCIERINSLSQQKKKNESEIQRPQVKNQQQINISPAILKPQPKNLHVSSDVSYEPSLESNGQNFDYNLREFSIQLPEGIHDPFEIKAQIEPISTSEQVEKVQTKLQQTKLSIKQSNNLNQLNLQKINEHFEDEYQSQQQQQLFLKKLISKLNMRKQISMKEIKKLSQQIRQLSEKNVQLIEIFQTGTYELDYIYKGSHIDWHQKYIDKVNSWQSRVLITQMSISQKLSDFLTDNFFMNIQLPSLQQITIKMQDGMLLNSKGQQCRIRDSKFTISFFKYNGLCNRLKTLSLIGETLTLQVARNIVDLDFPNLRSFYLGFESHFSDEVVEMLICAKFGNMPKSTIYIATWDGEIDTRFRYFYQKIKFIPLEQGELYLSVSQLKYRAKKNSINPSKDQQKWKQGIQTDLQNYFQQKNISQQN